MEKPSIELIRDCLNRDISFDFKKIDFEDSDSIIRFLKYKKPSSNTLDYDMSESTMSILAQYIKEVTQEKKVLFEKRYIYINDRLIGETDTLNSFWTTYRALLEFVFMQNNESNMYDKELLYEFILIFGGISSRKRITPKLNEIKYSEYGVVEDEFLKVVNYFSDYKGRYDFKLDKYLAYCNGTRKVSDKELQEERLEWLIAHKSDLEKIIVCVGGIDLYEELMKFAELTHSIGDFGIVPYGFNVGRASLTKDYFDLSLVTLMGMCPNREWYDVTVKWFADNYKVACAYECYYEQSEVMQLFDDHTFENMIPSTVQQFKDYFRKVNLLIIERGNRILNILKASEEIKWN